MEISDFSTCPRAQDKLLHNSSTDEKLKRCRSKLFTIYLLIHNIFISILKVQKDGRLHITSGIFKINSIANKGFCYKIILSQMYCKLFNGVKYSQYLLDSLGSLVSLPLWETNQSICDACRQVCVEYFL